MAIFNSGPPVVEWQMKVSAVGDVIEGADAPDTLEPYRLLGYEPGDFRIRNGWPVEPPPYDVRTVPTASATGGIIANRPEPGDITTNATARWIASNYNEGTYKWLPSQGSLTQGWTSDATFKPEKMTGLVYRVGKKFVVRDAVYFDPETDAHMWSEFAGEFGNQSDYTIIMALNIPRSKVSNDDDTSGHAGILTPRTPAVSDPSLHFDDGDLKVRAGTAKNFRRAFKFYRHQISARPIYLAYVVGHPRIRLWIGRGPHTLRGWDLFYEWDAVTMNMNLNLGRTSADTTHTAKMKVFDICLYNSRLTAPEVAREVGKLSRAYGGR